MKIHSNRNIALIGLKIIYYLHLLCLSLTFRRLRQILDEINYLFLYFYISLFSFWFKVGIRITNLIIFMQLIIALFFFLLYRPKSINDKEIKYIFVFIIQIYLNYMYKTYDFETHHGEKVITSEEKNSKNMG